MSGLAAELQASGLFAKKSLGQHFLLDPSITRRIAQIAGPLEGQCVLEIGPGPGGLTRALLGAGAARVIAVERDARFSAFLQALVAQSDGRLEVIEADALEIDEAALLAARGIERATICANLPYNIGTALLVKWLKAPSPWRTAMCLMFQKEVAQRITAQPGAEAYGRLAVLAQSVCRVRLDMTLPAGAFTPPPKVASAVVRLDPLAAPFADLPALETVTGAAFGQRRKMLRQALKPLTASEELLGQAGIAGDARAETIDVAGFWRLATAWRARAG